ncbi:MAG TPA: hypothetical protein VHG93_16835 [Longimicrobium sp.]|nr:hypothetical protein [Longimicrobium sp.]
MRQTWTVVGAVALTSVLAACPPSSYGPFPDGDGTSVPLYGDTLVDVTSTLVDNLRLIDSAGRARGTLPERLEEVVPAHWMRDFFGNTLQYSTAGLTFTLRSLGRDGLPETDDDIFVVGRLGRSVPCELHRGPNDVALFQTQAPLCRDVPITVLPKCLDAEYGPVPEFDPGRRRRPQERVLATGERLVRLARRIDGRGRSVGALPPPSAMLGLKFEDAWGQRVGYRIDGHAFELRSAGPDGVPGNQDDIVVSARLGDVIPCVFTAGGEVRHCSVPPPECPQPGPPITGA